MSRSEEIRELKNTISRSKAYHYNEWCKDFCYPSQNPKRWHIIIAGGNVIDKLSETTKSHKVAVVDIDGVPHTVVIVKAGCVAALKRAKSLRTFFHYLCTLIAEPDLKKHHYHLWVAAHNLEANVSRLQELETRPSPSKDMIGREVDGIFSNNTIREAAKHYGSL